MRTVLAGFDASPSSQDAVRLAAHVARESGARLVVSFVFRRDRMDERDSAEWREFVRGVAERELEAARDLAGSGELVPFGAEHPARGLQELATERDAGLIVVGSTHRGPLGRIVPGAVGQRLLREAPCPVGVVPRGWDADADWPARVVVGYDRSPEAELAMALARDVASRRGVDVEPLTVEDGDPADTIAVAAGEDDLIVVGSRGFSPLAAAMRDSVAADVMRLARCPVLVTPRSLTAAE